MKRHSPFNTYSALMPAPPLLFLESGMVGERYGLVLSNSYERKLEGLKEEFSSWSSSCFSSCDHVSLSSVAIAQTALVDSLKADTALSLDAPLTF